MSEQLDLFVATAPITSQAKTTNAWREVVLSAREQQGSRLAIARPFGGIWDRVTSPAVPRSNDDWPALWRFYCHQSPHVASSATLAAGYQERKHQ